MIGVSRAGSPCLQVAAVQVAGRDVPFLLTIGTLIGFLGYVKGYI